MEEMGDVPIFGGDLKGNHCVLGWLIFEVVVIVVD